MHIYRHQFNKDQSKTHFKCCYKYSKRNGFNLYNLFSTESYLINDIFFIKDGLENEKKNSTCHKVSQDQGNCDTYSHILSHTVL